MLKAFGTTIGFENLHAIHINDSKKGCGSRVDRHAHIGKGEIGEEAIKRFLRAKEVKNLPMYLETEKGTDELSGQDWDVINLNTVRRLAGCKTHTQE
jgi:deoxyribonuclease-4